MTREAQRSESPVTLTLSGAKGKGLIPILQTSIQNDKRGTEWWEKGQQESRVMLV